MAEAQKEYKAEEKRSDSANEELVKLQEERDRFEKWISDSKEKIRLAQKELANANENEQKFERDFFSSKKRIEARNGYEKEHESLRNLQKKKESHEKAITGHLFDENRPWLLMGLNN